MAANNDIQPSSMRFESVEQADVPIGRNSKHRGIVAQLLSDIMQLESGKALKVPLDMLGDSKENVRSALNRVTRERDMNISTSSDDRFLYIWKS